MPRIFGSLRWGPPKDKGTSGTNVTYIPTEESLEPKLPPELERSIFMYAYTNNPEDVGTLLCVARRVEEWLGPIFFKVVFLFPHQTFPLKFTLRTFLRYGKYIAHLGINLTLFKPDSDELLDFISNSGRRELMKVMEQILKACPNIVDLFVDHRRPTSKDAKRILPALSSISGLTHLAISLPRLLQQLPRVPRTRSIFSKAKNTSEHGVNPMFPGITHLQATDATFKTSTSDDSLQTQLLAAHFPNLTHLAVDGLDIYEKPDRLKLLLTRCGKLEELVLWWYWPFAAGREKPESTAFSTKVEDKRVVEVYCKERRIWKGGVEGEADKVEGLDVWEMAVQRRREMRGGRS